MLVSYWPACSHLFFEWLELREWQRRHQLGWPAINSVAVRRWRRVSALCEECYYGGFHSHDLGVAPILGNPQIPRRCLNWWRFVTWCSTIPCDSQPRWEFPGGLFPSRPQDIILHIWCTLWKPADRHGLVVGCERGLGAVPGNWGSKGGNAIDF